MKKILPFLLHPLMLAIVPTVVIIMLVPMKRDRYLLEVVDFMKTAVSTLTYFEDLTGNGYSEKISLNSNETNTWFIVYNHEGHAYNQWNLNGSYGFDAFRTIYLSGDYNGNGFRELFIFTISNDSIFMHALFDLTSDTLHIKNRFIATTGPGNLKPDPYIIKADMEDMDGDGKKELIFGIGAGFSLYPRSVFAYYIDNDSLVVSPPSYYNIFRIVQADLTGNGRREIILHGHASSNVRSDTVRYHDRQNWLMVLDQNLEFLFDPVALPEPYDPFYPFVFVENDNPFIGGIKASGHGFMPATYYLFDNTGSLQQKTELPGVATFLALAGDETDNDIIALTTDYKDLWIHDARMNQIRSMPSYGFHYYLTTDFDSNGQQEFVCLNYGLGKIHVFRQGFRFPASAEFNWTEVVEPIICVIWRGDDSPRLFLQAGQNQYTFDYGLNPMYHLSFGVYFLIYAGVLAFTFLTRSAQRRQISKQRETEKRIAELQINLIKNKLDPHFSINALNSVIQAIRDDRRDVAEDGLLQFVGMYRNMLLSADSVDRSLDEELAFTESYLKLEKLRYDGVFDYSIEVARGVDHATLVPKMVVQLHAENAVKHGLAPLGQGGRLHIGVNSSEVGLQIAIIDNGIGFSRGVEASGPRRSQGLKLMQEFYHLYTKISGRMIQSHIEELSDAQGEPAGTRVTIIIREKS